MVCILEKFAYEWENAAANATLSLSPDFHLVKRDFWRLSSQRAFLETKNVQKFLATSNHRPNCQIGQSFTKEWFFSPDQFGPWPEYKGKLGEIRINM